MNGDGTAPKGCPVFFFDRMQCIDFPQHSKKNLGYLKRKGQKPHSGKTAIKFVKGTA